MSTAKYLFAVPAAQVIYQDRFGKDGKHEGREVIEVVSAYRGLIWAIESIAHGEKINEVRDFRKRLIESYDERDFNNDAAFLLISAEEKGFLDQAVKTFDWTFAGKVQFWVRWDEFFDGIRDIKLYDETKPDVTYVEWKRAWDAKQEAKKAAKLKAEQEAVELKRQAEAKAAQELQAEIDLVLETKLSELKEAGKYGHAAVVTDLPADVRAEAEVIARATIAQRKIDAETAKTEVPKTNAPKADDVKIEETKVPQLEADEII